jgi:hypothetical protein
MVMVMVGSEPGSVQDQSMIRAGSEQDESHGQSHGSEQDQSQGVSHGSE